jgi:guanylate kinase
MNLVCALGRMVGIRPIVITGPSGTGKSTIFNRVMAEHPNTFAFSVSRKFNYFFAQVNSLISDTTRQMRPGEQDGVHYHFVSKEYMTKMIEDGDFVEHATFGGNTYGTSKKAIQDIEVTGKICVLDLELKGVRNMKKLNYPAKYILICAPSLEILVSQFMIAFQKLSTLGATASGTRHRDAGDNSAATPACP